MISKRWLWVAVGILAFLGLGGLSGLAFLSYKIRDIKEPLLSALRSYIDGELKIGEAKVVMVPTGINLHDVTLFAPGETQPSATVKKAEIRFNLLPLLQKKFETRLVIIDPVIHFHRDRQGRGNMERIFRPLMEGDTRAEISQVDQLWWRRLAVDKLIIRNADFTATAEGKPEGLRMKGLNIEADRIRFDSAQEPARISIGFSLPELSRDPLELTTRMAFREEKQTMELSEGRLRWGKAVVDFGGEALLPGEKQKEAALSLKFSSQPIDLKALGKSLKDPIPLSGDLRMSGTIEGNPFAPILRMQLQSPAIGAGGKTLSNLHAQILKKTSPIEVEKAGFGIFGGTVGVKGTLNPGSPLGGNLHLNLQSLSLAAASGKKGSPARLSGALQISSPNLANPVSWSGGGEITVGPIPLPAVDMKGKIQIAQVLSAGTQLGRMINLGMLSSSRNVIGSEVSAIGAKVKISGGNISLAPFSLGNGHFSASGSGTIFQQKSLRASGNFTLNPQVTAQLFPDPKFRSVVTGGKGVVSFPFTASGPLEDPQINVDSSHLRSMIAKAGAMGLANILAGGIQPDQMLNTALKNTSLADPKNPLSQILGTSTPQKQTTSNTTTTRGSTTRKTTSSSGTTTQNKSTKPITGNRLADQLLFGK